MAEDSKTEKASPKKRRDERKKGNVFKSQDVIVIICLMGCFTALRHLVPMIGESIRNTLVIFISYVSDIDSYSTERVMRAMSEVLIEAAKCIFPMLIASAALGILASGIQTKFIFSADSIKPKFSKMDPIKGIQKMFALKNVVELIKNIIKISILLVILINFIKDRVPEVINAMNMELEMSANYVMTEIIALVKLAAMWFIVIAGFDFMYQWWDYERQIKMSKQEVKEEYKQTEGNPEIKGKIKDIQRQRARSRMMQEVPEADVIIRNPTHYAVALKYDDKVSNAPVVIAKGQDELALRIVEVAEAHKICVIENKPLTRAIYASTNINQEIPPEFYGAVAEVLVYVYKLNNKVLK